MEIDPEINGILSFKHCNNDVTCYCMSFPSLCPLCGKCLTNAESVFKSIPTRISYPFAKGSQTPCAIILKPSRGNFLRDYVPRDDFHIGITSSSSIVTEFDIDGLKNGRGKEWDQCLIVEQMKKEAWIDRWDVILRNLSTLHLFTKENYQEEGFNCYTFVIYFLKEFYRNESRKTKIDKEFFCEETVAPRLMSACNYINLHRGIAKRGYLLSTDNWIVSSPLS